MSIPDVLESVIYASHPVLAASTASTAALAATEILQICL